MATVSVTNQTDVILVGAGIMSSTLAVFRKDLDPSLNIQLHEVLGKPAQESSNAWNNAGTGHAALCELNYTPQEPDCSIDISKALQVNTEFDLSRQFWAYLVNKGAIKDPQSFLHSVPHMSFVHGLENRTFLKKRFKALSAHPLYYGMKYSEDKKQIGEWIPLVMEGRDASDTVTASGWSMMSPGSGHTWSSRTVRTLSLCQIRHEFAEWATAAGFAARHGIDYKLSFGRNTNRKSCRLALSGVGAQHPGPQDYG